MTALLIVFALLTITAVLFSFMPVLPGPPFAITAVMLIPLWPDLPSAPDDLTWWVAGSVGVMGLVITVIDLAAPWLARIFEGVLGRSSRSAAIGSVVGLFVGVMLSIASGCFGVAIPVLAALPVPLMLVTPFLGALVGESMADNPPGELAKDRTNRIFRSALVQWLGLLTTIVLKVAYCILVMPIGFWLIVRNWS